MGRIRRYFQAKLRRRIFLWFGATIAISGCAVALVGKVFGPGNFMDTWRRAQTFVGNRFAEVWDDPKKRESLALQTSAELDAAVRVVELPSGRSETYGGTCHGPRMSMKIRRHGKIVGKVTICTSRRGGHGAWFPILMLVAAGLTLWGASGWIARRLVRPLEALTQVARDIGAGRLTSRVKLGRYSVGEVGALAETINDMAERIEKQMADQRELLAAVSHEIRTPLGHMRIVAELARERGVSAETLHELEQEVLEIDGLVDELLASSRVDFDALAITELDGQAVAARALERAGLGIERLEMGVDDPSLAGDATLLQRALANLLDNAAKHGGGVKVLRVTRRGPGDRAALAFEVDDEGPGFPDEARKRAFDPFYRGAPRGEKTRSSLGLGLALVRRIARAHGGEAWAENLEPGARVGFSVARRVPRD